MDPDAYYTVHLSAAPDLPVRLLRSQVYMAAPGVDGGARLFLLARPLEPFDIVESLEQLCAAWDGAQP